MEQLLSGMTVTAAYPHEGEARRLVHALKYQAHPFAAKVLAHALVPLLPAGAGALVPVPRVVLRRVRFGVDPARELATVLGRLAGLEVMMALQAPWWSPPRAARNRAGRPPVFRARVPVPPGTILVDDVATTGATLAAASAALGGRVSRALTATAVWA